MKNWFKNPFSIDPDRLFTIGALLLLIIVASSYFYLIPNWSPNISHPANYIEGIRSNFWEYLYYFHVKPPGLLIKDKLLTLFFSNSYTGKAHFFIIFSLYFLGSFLLFISIRRISNNIIALFFAPLAYFLGLIFLAWRNTLHYDHYNYFIHCYIIYTWISIYKENTKSRWSYINSVLSLSLGILTYSPAVILLFVSLVQAFFKDKIIVRWLLIPISIFLLIIGKNFFVHGILSPSSLSGPTRLTNGFYFHDGFKGVSKFINNGDYPEWWKKCFYTAHDNFHNFVGPLYGVCFHRKDSREFDLNFLKENIGPIKDQRVIEVLNRDQKMLTENPLIFSGPVPEFSLGFSVLYGQVAGKVWRDLVLKFPKSFIPFTKRALSHFTLERGSNFFSGTSYEPQYMPLKFPFPSLIQKFLKFGNLLLFFFPIIGIIYIFKDGLKNIKPNLNHKLIVTGMCWFSTVSIVSIFSVLVCCENDRMYASLIPYMFVIILGSLTLTKEASSGIIKRLRSI